MRKLPTWLPALAVFAGVFTAVFTMTGGSDTPSFSVRDAASVRDTADDQSQPESQPESQSESVFWSHGADGSARNGDEHWQKHGSDFPEFHDADDYERGAADFVHNPPPGARIKHRSNGDTLVYDPGSNTFAVEDRRGEPRTFFRPRHGDAYWDRQ